MLRRLITRLALEELAGATAFRRGEEYFSSGAVERLHATEEKVSAKVQGTEAYRAELRKAGDGELGYDCTCPRAADGYFCKHCVAVGLAWLDEPLSQSEPRAKTAKKGRRDPWREIRNYLTTQDPSTLIDLLIETAQRDDRLYRSLFLQTDRSGRGDVVRTFRRAIDDATRIDDFIDWRETGTFAADVDDVVDSLAELLKPDSAAVLLELAEYAIERLEQSLEQIDDSNGQIGDIVHRLGELHLKSCSMARPEPVGLADRLFHLEMTQAFGLCSFDAARYGSALGKAGLRRYRELAEAEWLKVKPRNGGDRYDERRFRVTRIMEQLAEASGDVEELVAIKARDLSSSYRYLDIAQTWAKARQPAKALEWAERGLKAFPDRPDNRLRDFLVDAYVKRGRNDEALQLTWIQFEEHPGLELYEKLQGVAEKLGVWPAQRSRALSLVEDRVKRAATSTNKWQPKPSSPDQSLRVEIALWEQDFDAAWAAAHDGTCNRNLLIALAGKLEKSRPSHAVSLYRRVIPTIVEHTNNAAYAEAVSLIRKIARLMKAQDEARELSDYLAQLRVQFKAKRNFIKLLDRAGRTAVEN